MNKIAFYILDVIKSVLLLAIGIIGGAFAVCIFADYNDKKELIDRYREEIMNLDTENKMTERSFMRYRQEGRT